MKRQAGARSLCAAAFGLAALIPIVSPAEGRNPPKWWDIEVRLTTKGRYSLTEGGTAYSGEYVLRETWWGNMEKDQDDYRLFHARQETLEWKFLEKADSGGLKKILTEKDCPAGPSFRINYVLRENNLVRFNIGVDDFPVPRNGARAEFNLLLPRSKTDAQNVAALPYDGNISRGSNDVVLEEKAILSGPVERMFQWEWKGYQPPPVPESAVALFNFHQAEVSISVTPRY
jgi:hypothetical protein